MPLRQNGLYTSLQEGSGERKILFTPPPGKKWTFYKRSRERLRVSLYALRTRADRGNTLRVYLYAQ